MNFLVLHFGSKVQTLCYDKKKIFKKSKDTVAAGINKEYSHVTALPLQFATFCSRKK